jgi:hypothetical protein
MYRFSFVVASRCVVVRDDRGRNGRRFRRGRLCQIDQAFQSVALDEPLPSLNIRFGVTSPCICEKLGEARGIDEARL